MSTTVHVSGISHQTSETEVREFFAFCGKITNLSVTPQSSGTDASLSATVTFEKETAAKTALLLDNTQLGASCVHVTSASSLDDIAGSKAADHSADEVTGDLSQEDKPRSRIVAEYLAHGYVISDHAIQKAIALDNKHGVSSRFTQTLSNFDSKYHASDRARSMDTSYGISDKASAGWRGLSSYFEKAMGTPTGQRVREFYMAGDKQVRDVHAEARRLADIKSGKTSAGATPPPPVVGEAKQVDEEGHTTCGCGGNDGVCVCAAGKCRCSSCAKNQAQVPAQAPAVSLGEKAGDAAPVTTAPSA